jgi:nicotinamide-nucleotide amidase
MFSPEDQASAQQIINMFKEASCKIVTAESCTGGLLGALLTETAGASEVYERGFITYSNAAKTELLGVSPLLIENYGAVSEHVALAMAEGALLASQADMALSITGIAGPGGGSKAKPVGLVFFGLSRKENPCFCVEKRFGTLSRTDIRLLALRQALSMITDACHKPCHK